MSGHGGNSNLNPSHLVRLCYLSSLDLLCRQGEVVAVTFNYRLNVFGFLAADLSGKEENEIQGNYGLHDQIVALQVHLATGRKHGPTNLLVDQAQHPSFWRGS